ncbi:MAG: hypothetical protein ACP5LX_07085, partial [Nitrososphaeria archaeon]
MRPREPPSFRVGRRSVRYLYIMEFRSKKENGKVIHYPIRKPFGESRDEALKEVLKLREENKRARLIETNRKHKLYAPYVSTLQENNEAETGSEPPKEEATQT